VRLHSKIAIAFAALAAGALVWLLVPRRELHGDDTLRLHPWARVTGTVTLDGKPAANLALQSHDPEESAPVEGEPRLVRRHYVKTDADGRFELPRVMPGRLTLAQWVPNGTHVSSLLKQRTGLAAPDGAGGAYFVCADYTNLATNDADLRLHHLMALRRPKLGEMVAFRKEIERLRNSFLEWRYLHERNRASEIRFAEMIFVMEVLDITCRAHDKLVTPQRVTPAGIIAESGL